MDIEKLAKQFVELVEERDFIVEFQDDYNERCYEIDDQLIPSIIESVSASDSMIEFNQLVDSIFKDRGYSSW